MRRRRRQHPNHDFRAESHRGMYVISSMFIFIWELFCPLVDQCGREKQNLLCK
jgi:hypothetical protein